MKTIEQLTASTEEIFGRGLNANVYLGVKVGEAIEYRRANLTDKATQSVCESYVASVRSYLHKEELTTHPVSEMDRRADVLWHYDLDDEPEEFAALRAVRKVEPSLFSFDEFEVKDIKSIVVKIASAENSIVFFKPVYPISIIKRDQILMIKSGTRFDVVDEDVLKLTGGFEVLFIDDEIYVNDFPKFERAFGFTEVADRAAKAVGQKVLALGIVSDIKGHIANGVGSRRDIMRTSKSVVLQLDIQQILDFALAKQDKIGLQIVDGKLQITSKESVKHLYRLLNDDYLTSGLTAIEYEALAKNKMV